MGLTNEEFRSFHPRFPSLPFSKLRPFLQSSSISTPVRHLSSTLDQWDNWLTSASHCIRKLLSGTDTTAHISCPVLTCLFIFFPSHRALNYSKFCSVESEFWGPFYVNQRNKRPGLPGSKQAQESGGALATNLASLAAVTPVWGADVALAGPLAVDGAHTIHQQPIPDFPRFCCLRRRTEWNLTGAVEMKTQASTDSRSGQRLTNPAVF